MIMKLKTRLDYNVTESYITYKHGIESVIIDYSDEYQTRFGNAIIIRLILAVLIWSCVKLYTLSGDPDRLADDLLFYTNRQGVNTCKKVDEAKRLQ